MHACHKQRDVILPRTTWTFHVAPEAGCARRTGPTVISRRLFLGAPRACITFVPNKSIYKELLETMLRYPTKEERERHIVFLFWFLGSHSVLLMCFHLAKSTDFLFSLLILIGHIWTDMCAFIIHLSQMIWLILNGASNQNGKSYASTY